MTLRELVWMAESRAAFEWDRTSAILALIYNVNRSSRQKSMTPAQFNPYANRRRGATADRRDLVIPCEIGVLKTIFIDGAGKRRKT